MFVLDLNDAQRQATASPRTFVSSTSLPPLPLSIDDGVFKVLATSGDTHLGDEDFDHRAMEYFTKVYKKNTVADVSHNLRALGKPKREVEKAKRMPSSKQYTRLEIESFESGNDFSNALTHAKFRELNMDLFRKTMKPVEQALKDTNLKEEDIDEVSQTSDLNTLNHNN